VIGSFTRTDNAAAAEAKLREAVRTFHAGGITEQERAEAVGYLLGQAPFSRQSPANVLFRRMGERSLGLPQGFHDELPQRAAELTLEAINAFIREYYVPEELVMNRVAPE
jgi:predicted Zn-dependent peptidase